MIEYDRKILFSILGQIHPLRFVLVVIFIIFLVIVHHIKVCRCQVFGHVHKFWSYFFNHLHLVMLTTLINGLAYI